MEFSGFGIKDRANPAKAGHKYSIANIQFGSSLPRLGTYPLAGVGGFEPPNAGSKGPCLTT